MKFVQWKRYEDHSSTHNDIHPMYFFLQRRDDGSWSLCSSGPNYCRCHSLPNSYYTTFFHTLSLIMTKPLSSKMSAKHLAATSFSNSAEEWNDLKTQSRLAKRTHKKQQEMNRVLKERTVLGLILFAYRVVRRSEDMEMTDNIYRLPDPDHG